MADRSRPVQKRGGLADTSAGTGTQQQGSDRAHTYFNNAREQENRVDLPQQQKAHGIIVSFVFFFCYLQRHASAQHSSSSLLTLPHRQSPQEARPIRPESAGKQTKTVTQPSPLSAPAHQMHNGLSRARKNTARTH